MENLRSSTDTEALVVHAAATLAQNDSLGGLGTLDTTRIPWYVDLAEALVREVHDRKYGDQLV